MSLTFTPEKPVVFRQRILLMVALWVAVLISSITIVYTSHDTRNKFNELELLRGVQNELQVKWGQYLLEESAWASYGRIESVAVEKLSMQVPSAQQIIMVNSHD